MIDDQPINYRIPSLIRPTLQQWQTVGSHLKRTI